MYLKVKGLVLRVTAFNDTDSLLTLITHDQGKLTIKARGLRRKNSPLTAACQLLAYSEFTLFENRGYYSIQEAQTIELFTKLRADLCKLSLATYFAQVAEVMSQEDQSDPELLSLVLNCLYALSKLDISQTQVKAVFEFRCACLGGYLPDLSGCHQCGNSNPDRFDVSQARLSCSGCHSFDDGSIRLPMDASVLAAMRYVAGCEPKRLFLFRVGDEALERFSSLSETYLSTQLERGFSALDFYKSLLCT